jgi:lipid-A-disaccharide synthase
VHGNASTRRGPEPGPLGRPPSVFWFNAVRLYLLFSAGEASGDLHGARLLAALRSRRPDLRAFGMGGPRLEAEGLDRVAASESLSVVGIFEVAEKLPALLRALSGVSKAARERRPDAAVLIDFPDFHGLLASRLRRAGVPLVYYVSPQVWAWRSGRARRIAREARRIITLFPFEAEIYRRLGGDAVCAGHPLVDDVREGLARPSPLPVKTRRRLVLLPGSRTAELRRHWRPMADAARALASRFDLELVAVRAPGLGDELFDGAEARGILLAGSSAMHALLATADLSLVASGTATLEAALCGSPMIVVYRASPGSYAIGKRLVRVPWISLVNIVGQAPIVPELLQNDVTSQRLEEEASTLLGSPEGLEAQRRQLARVAAELGPPGASERAADAVLEVLPGGRP